MEFEHLIRERFSVRGFKKQKIEEWMLDKILEAGLVAPTAKNNQPQRVYILKSDEALEKINAISKCIYNAPIVLLVCYDSNVSFKNTLSGEDSGVEDASIVCTHMMLEAWNIGLGSCWVNLYDSSVIKEVFCLEENIKPVCLLPIGYKEDNVEPSKMHYESKNKEEIYFEL